MTAAFTRQWRTKYIQRSIDFHLERAKHLEDYADHWWRQSKYAWLAAANIHRFAAQELADIRLWIENECRDD